MCSSDLLNQSMAAELDTTKKNLAKAEQLLESERQSHKDALTEVQDRLNRRLDESLAIDNQLLSKYRKNLNSSLCLSQI